jgi:hypothetical protein
LVSPLPGDFTTGGSEGPWAKVDLDQVHEHDHVNVDVDVVVFGCRRCSRI